MLSPASQLDVLSQISELAERNRRESISVQAKPIRDQTSSTSGNTSRPHVWATAQYRRKKRAPPAAMDEEVADDDACGSLVALVTGSSKKKKTHVPQHSDKLEADMLDWETCSGEFIIDEVCDEALWSSNALPWTVCIASLQRTSSLAKTMLRTTRGSSRTSATATLSRVPSPASS